MRVDNIDKNHMNYALERIVDTNINQVEIEEVLEDINEITDFNLDLKLSKDEKKTFLIGDLSKLLQTEISKLQIQDRDLEKTEEVLDIGLKEVKDKGLDSLNLNKIDREELLEKTLAEKSRGRTTIIIEEEGSLSTLIIDGGKEDKTFKIKKDLRTGKSSRNIGINRRREKLELYLKEDEINLNEEDTFIFEDEEDIIEGTELIEENLNLDSPLILEDRNFLPIELEEEEEIDKVYEKIEDKRKEIKRETESLRDKVRVLERERRERRKLLKSAESKEKVETIRNNIVEKKEEHLNRIDPNRFEHRENVYILLK